MRLSSIFDRQKRAVLLVVFLLSAAGIAAAFRIPVAIFPQTNFPRIVILVDNGVVPAERMLVSVTRPIEEAMNGIQGIARIRSTTSRGAAEINLFFDWKVDILQSQQLVQARLSQLTLPPTASIRRVDRLTFAVFPVAGYSLTSDSRDLATLRDLAEWTIKPRLARLPGIASVAVAGGLRREFHVRIEPDQLTARSITLRQVTDAIRSSNIVASPGLLEENHRLELVLVSGEIHSTSELEQIVVVTRNGAPITLAMVAEVKEGVAPEYTIVTANGKRAVLLNVLRQPDANTVATVREVESELAAMKPALPPDVRIAPFYDQSLLVQSAIASVRDAIIIGLLLSIAVLFAFLRNWGTTVVAVAVIPVTVLVTFLAMSAAGLTFDLMTLGGIAAAIGLVIDDAIVVVENIFTHIARGKSRTEAIRAAVDEITVPLIGSTITPMVVFLPLTLLTGVTGVFFRSLAMTMIVSLLTSLVLALTFTPVLAGWLVRHRPSQETPESRDVGTEVLVDDREEAQEAGVILRWIGSVYEHLLDRALRHRAAVMVVAAVVLSLTYVLYRHVGSEFLPTFDEGAFVLDYAAPSGSSLAETDRMLRHAEDFLRATPEIESWSRRTGLQLGLAITEPNTGDFLVKLKAAKARPTAAVIDELRAKIESAEPALRIEFVGILTDLIGDLTSSPAPIEVKVFAEDAVKLEAKAREIGAVISKVKGVVDVFDGIVVSGPAVTFRVDPARATRFGLTVADVAAAVSTALTGDEATTVLDRGRVIPIRVTLPLEERRALQDLRGLQFESPAGVLYTLDQVGDITYDAGQAEIHRENLRRAIPVTARLSGTDMGTAIRAIQSDLARNVSLPPGVSVEYGGLYHEQQASFRELLVALLLAILFVFLVLVVEFRSFVHPVAIVTGSILALSGVFAALWLTGTTLNVVSFVGMIMVIGIVAKNGILMLDAVDERIDAGDTVMDALLRSGRRRLRPVLMTSLAAILGMLPLALAIGSGAEMLQPLAISVVGGLSVALLFSLVVTPTVFAILRERRH